MYNAISNGDYTQETNGWFLEILVWFPYQKIYGPVELRWMCF